MLWGAYHGDNTVSDIPAECIYNMDEMGNDMTKHQSKILYKKNRVSLI